MTLINIIFLLDSAYERDVNACRLPQYGCKSQIFVLLRRDLGGWLGQKMPYFHPYRCPLGFSLYFHHPWYRGISQVKGIVRTEEKNFFDRQSPLHAVFTPFCWLSKGLFIWYRTDFRSGMSFVPESASSSGASFFAQRWARNASDRQVTVKEAQGTMGKRKMRGENFIERERPLYSHDRIERPSLRRVDQTRMRHSLQTTNMTCGFQCGKKFVSS